MDKPVCRERRRTRSGLALSIVVGGVALACLVGRSSPSPPADASAAGDHLVLRRRAASQVADAPHAASSDAPARAAAPPFRILAEATAAVEGGKPDALPPNLASSFPAVDRPGSARWGVSMGISVPGTKTVEPSVRTHRIVNGDSLPALAKRYLGSEDRSPAIFEANRDLLTSPDALPIGVELRIPSRDAARPAREPAASPELVPIAPRSRRSQQDVRRGAS